MHDGQSSYTYQSTNDSIVDIFSNPSSITNVLPTGGVSAIATANDTLLVAFAGDDNDTPIGLGLAFTPNARDWYETEPSEIMSFTFSWDSSGSDISNGVYFGFDSGYQPGSGYSGSFLVISPLNELDKISIKDSVKTQYTINPKDYGITGKDSDSIKTSNEKSSLDFIFSVINNEESDAREICVLNAALSVMLYKDIELNDSISQCRESLSEYKVRDKFNQYIDFTNQV